MPVTPANLVSKIVSSHAIQHSSTSNTPRGTNR